VPHRAALAGPRVRLRSPRPEDADAFVTATTASRSFHRPWVSPPTARPGYRVWLREGDDGRRERYLVWRDDVLVGYAAINEIVWASFQSGYLGYWAVADHAGQGLMREALTVLLDHALGRRRLPLHRVEANVQPRNEPSLALVRALGMRREGYSPRYLRVAGRWRDHERWAITAEEWRRRR
jgi:ribosomal-protein-alanine N-acetyltransferase